MRVGWTSQCAPCKHSENQHDERHREIAELLHQLKDLHSQEPANEAPSVTPKTKRNQIQQTASPMPKKERKAAKKAAKLAGLPKVITTADIEFVAKILHPNDHEGDDAEEERRLLEDPDIKLNLYYHKGTSNHKEVRHRHIKRKQKGGNGFLVDDEELDGLLAEMKVPKASEVKLGEERRLVDRIRKAVENDLINVAKEQEQTQMRKAGFWRWASKKVYTRLLQNGRLWDQTGDAMDSQKRKDSAYVRPDDDEDGAAQLAKLDLRAGDDTSAGAESTMPTKVSTPTSEKRKSMPASPKSSTTEGDWMHVGKKSRAAPSPNVQLKMSGNGGLAKLMVKPKGMFGALGSAGLGYKADDDSD